MKLKQITYLLRSLDSQVLITFVQFIKIRFKIIIGQKYLIFISALYSRWWGLKFMVDILLCLY